MSVTGKVNIGGDLRELTGEGYVNINGVLKPIAAWKFNIDGVLVDGVPCVSVDPVLDNNDWATISEMSATGQAANYWNVGDCKAVLVNGTVGTLAINQTLYVYIIGFDHNGATNSIDFGTFKTAASGGTDVCLIDSNYGGYSTDGKKYLNMGHWSYYNYGGWKGCDLRYDVLGSTNKAPSGYGSEPSYNNRAGNDASSTCATSPVSKTLMAALPSDLRAVMKPMTIYTDNVGKSSNDASDVTTSVDYLPLLSEFEVQGTRKYANSTEKNYQKRYAYYSAGNKKVKYQHSSTGSSAKWWVRSPYYNSNAGFCEVSTGGSANYESASRSGGVAPIFRV